MDEFLNSFANLCSMIMPMLVAAVLVCLIILLIRLIKLLKSVQDSTDKLPNTIGLVDESLEKVQAPLDTVVKVSNTVEKVHDGTVELVDKTKEYIVTNFDTIKDKVSSLSKKNEEKKIKKPKKEDVGE